MKMMTTSMTVMMLTLTLFTHLPGMSMTQNYLRLLNNDDLLFNDLIQDVLKVSSALPQKKDLDQKIALQKEKKQKDSELKLRKKNMCIKISHVYIPFAAISFVVVYWAIGLKNAQFFQDNFLFLTILFITSAHTDLSMSFL